MKKAADQTGNQPPVSGQETNQEEVELLSRAMAGVTKLRTKPTTPRPNGPRRKPSWSDKATEGVRLLQDFVRGRTPFEWTFHPGYQEGGPQSGNYRLLKKLRRGDFSVQAQLDLHGLNQADALVALETFLNDCSRQNLNCVRIIHGKGKNSANNKSVLKEQLPKWLSLRRIARLIVAYTSAPPTDGGVGATYVLLRKRARTGQGRSSSI